jgi:acetyl esterase/lipase
MTSVAFESGHVFATIGETTLGLDLYRAPQADAPLVVYVHGGAWRSGDKADGGASAGAYLGSLLALTAGDEEFEGAVGSNLDQSSEVQAVVHWFGQSDLLASGSRTDVEARLLPFTFEADLLGVRSVVEVPDRARGLSLLTRVSPKAPPFLIAHGDRDHVVAPSESEALHHALSRAGGESDFMLLGGAGHEGPEFDRPATIAMTAAWLRAKLARPTTS